MDGTWKSQDVWGGFSMNMVQMSDYKNMPDDVKAMAADTAAKIKSGEIHPFQGPIRKQDGTEVVGAGERLSDEVLLGMNFYVEGVEGDLPQ